MQFLISLYFIMYAFSWVTLAVSQALVMVCSKSIILNAGNSGTKWTTDYN